MKKTVWLSLLFLFGCVSVDTAKMEVLPVKVNVETDRGTITLELDKDNAPNTVENFLGYAQSGFYDGTIFHRVMKGFMIQGGGLSEDMTKKETRAPVINEAENGLSNLRGTIAMARTPDPHSATAQFFINTEDNVFLNHRSKSMQGWGYCVFGRVVEGMDVVDDIENAVTGIKAGRANVPLTPIRIKKMAVVE